MSMSPIMVEECWKFSAEKNLFFCFFFFVLVVSLILHNFAELYYRIKYFMYDYFIICFFNSILHILLYLLFDIQCIAFYLFMIILTLILVI